MIKQIVEITPLFFTLFVFIAAFIAFSTLFMYVQNNSSYRRSVNRRLSLDNGFGDSVSSIEQLLDFRRQRSLSSDGQYVLPLVWLNRLILQSGITLGISVLLGVVVSLIVVTFATLQIFLHNVLVSISGSIFAGVIVPIFVLQYLKKCRQNKFEEQFPDAMDIMARCMKAGHPISISLKMVAQEMPAPIGEEFRIASNELNYGLDLETAMSNLRARIGQHDMSLVVVAISLQSQTGGNLIEILDNLSKVVRTRFRMRRKVKSLSAEGRYSALILSALPFIIFGSVWLLFPHYYKDIWDKDITKPVLIGAAMWMLLGNIIIRRMVNLKF